MSERELISIIVPVYNGENYIERCVQSLLSQTYSEIEIILVNDGSKDNSDRVCKNLADKNSRILYVCQENSGPGAARNTGILYATGRYIAFMDCDDFIHVTYLEELFTLMRDNRADVACCSYVKGGENDLPGFEARIHEQRHAKIFSKEEAMLSLFYRKEITAYPVLKLIDREVLGDLRFSTTLRLGEGMYFAYELLKRCERIVYTSKQLYFYYQNGASITNTLREEDMKKAWYLVNHTISDEIVSEKVRRGLNSKLFILALDFLTRTYQEKVDAVFKKELYDCVYRCRRGVFLDKKCSKSNRVLGLASMVCPPKLIVGLLHYTLNFVKKHNIRIKKAV